MNSTQLATVLLAIAAMVSSVSGLGGNLGGGGLGLGDNNRLFCTQCTDSNSATVCSSTQYCLHLNGLFMPGCCRDKQAAGGFCVPGRGGVDCTSGTCNNIIPSNINLFGVTLPFNTLNQWIGTCA